MTQQRLTQSDMILIAFFHASEGKTTKVPYEDLVIQAWKDFPEIFSLRNHPEHPDASDVHKKLYSSLKAEALVIAIGNKVFRLTDKGLDKAKQLVSIREGVVNESPEDKSRLSREDKSYIAHVLKTRAMTAWRDGKQEHLVDYDARLFFQFTTGTPLDMRKQKLVFANAAIDKAVATGQPDAVDLRDLSIYLAEKFQSLFQEHS